MHPIPPPDEASLPPRYAPERPLPPYRYVPGLLPHPSADPAGHSFGHPEPDLEALPPEAWARSVEYRYGVDLFNRRYYWEAHEAWERVWHTCDKARTQGLFVQGLIQLAAALLKWHMGSEGGWRKLRRFAFEKLAPARREAPAGYMGVALGPWLDEVEAVLAALPPAAVERRGPHPELPVIRLQQAPASGTP
jgi:hypothetical protein